MTEPQKTPELFVEKLAANELSEEMAARVQAQLESAQETDRIAEIHRSNQAILNEYPPAQLAASIRLRHQNSQYRFKRIWYLLPVSAVAAAAAMFFMMQVPPGAKTLPPNQGTSAAPYEGIKGSPQLLIHKQTTNGATPLKTGDTAAAGDVLQIKFNTSTAQSLVICSIDGRGTVTLHYPIRKDASTAVLAKGAQTLPFGYELDDAPNFERFFMVWSETRTNVKTAEILTAVKALKNARSDSLQLRAPFKYKDITVNK